jgi:hypothetical protein
VVRLSLTVQECTSEHARRGEPWGAEQVRKPLEIKGGGRRPRRWKVSAAARQFSHAYATAWPGVSSPRRFIFL